MDGTGHVLADRPGCSRRRRSEESAETTSPGILPNLESGRQAQRFQRTRERNIQLVGRVVRQALGQNSINIKEDPEFVGWLAYCIFQV